MPKIKKILFPVDFSPQCDRAAKYAGTVAARLQAGVTLLHVMTEGSQASAELISQRRAQLEAFGVDEFKQVNVRRLCVADSDPAGTIVAEAARWAADLVMMPTHGVGVFRRFLLGSTASKILHDVPCPVWTGSHVADPTRLEDGQTRKVLCAVDLGNRSEQILSWTAWLAGEFQASLRIVHASNQNEQAEKKIEELLKPLAASGTIPPYEIRICPGDPAEVIAAEAEEFGAGVVVIGRHSGSGLTGRLHPHAYAILSSSPCPVVSI